jgi:DNA-directed RNA polymerase subunit alpha
MSVKYGKFEMPQKIVKDEKTASKSFARFTAEPFERGFGHTIGNSMRRLMLSSLEAPAIVSVRVEGVPHEYMAIEGIVEDMTNIILNLKGALLRKLSTEDTHFSREPRLVSTILEVTREDLDKQKGQYPVKLGDLFKDGNFELVNPGLHLFTVTKPLKRQIDFRVAIGRGYVPSERLEVRDKVANEILIDAAFSPVRLVNYFVENTRVGQDTDYDSVVFEVTTDGRVSPQEALSFASQIAVKHFDVFHQVETNDLVFDEGEGDSDGDRDEMMEKLSLRIDEIELSVRSTNCLSGANIETIAELVSIPEKRMLEFRNFGKKSLNEIKAKLMEMGLSLGMDLSRFDINEDNVKQRMAEYEEERKTRGDLDESTRYKWKKGEKTAPDPDLDSEDDEEEDEDEE